MEKLRLERELEGALYELGTQLGERVYGEDLRLGAQVDDIINPARYGSLIEKFSRGGIIELQREESRLFGKLTEYQRNFLLSLTSPMFFKREARHRGFNLSYITSCRTRRAAYRPEADWIVRNDIEKEDIEVSYDKSPVASFSVSGETANSLIFVPGTYITTVDGTIVGKVPEGTLPEWLVRRMRTVGEVTVDNVVYKAVELIR